MTAQRNDIHDNVLAAIEGRIRSLRSETPTSTPQLGAWTQVEVDAELAQLERDQALLLAHWKKQDGVVEATTPARAHACGQPQPCPHVLGLAEKYGFI